MDTKGRKFIANFSVAFMRAWRVTILLFIGIVVMGYLSYTSFLKKEGFPAVQFPAVFVQTSYFVNDTEKVDNEVTIPIEDAISDIQELKSLQSTTSENISFIMAEFDEGTDSSDASRLLNEEIQKNGDLPENATVELSTINAGSMDGTHDFILTISDSVDTKELQAKAEEVATEVSKANGVAKAEAIKLIKTETNPITGEEFENKGSFNRIGFRENGDVVFENAVAVGVIKKEDVGTLDLSDSIREQVNKMIDNGDLDGFTITFNGDFAEDLNKQIDSLEENAVIGLIAVTIVVLLFISVRGSVVAGVFVPTTIAATLAGLFILGYSLNIIALFSLILVIGLLVDDAVIVIEAIDREKSKGKKGKEAVYDAIKSIGVADISGTVTTVLVFLPMAFISGILGDFIIFIPITVILSLLLSIFIALSIVPYMTNILIPDKKKEEIEDRKGFFGWFKKIEEKAADVSAGFVSRYLKSGKLTALTIVGTIGLIVLGTSFASKLKFSIFPTEKDSINITMSLSYPEGLTVDQAEDKAKEAEGIVVDVAGESLEEVSYFMGNKSQALVQIKLIPTEDRDITSLEIVENLNDRFEDFDGTRVKVEPQGAGPPTEDFQFFVQVFSDNQATLEEVTESIKGFLENKEVLGEKVTDVAVGKLLSISKKDKDRFAEVKAKISDPKNSAVIIELERLVKEEYNDEKLGEFGLDESDLGFDQGMESENVQSFQSAAFALLISLIIMYGVLVFQFNSFSQPLLILFAIPFTFAGLFPGLYITDNALSFFVMIGIIALGGIVVNNTILLTDFANQERAKGKGIRESITEAVRIRFRPLITTSLTTIAGLLPLSITESFWEPLGFTVVFGLIASTTLVILAFPAFYGVVEKLRGLKTRFRRI